MKGISKIFLIALFIIITLCLIFCKSWTEVYFESEILQVKVKNPEKFSKMFSDQRICVRVLTTNWTDIVFIRYSREEIKEPLVVENLKIFDDSGEEIYSNEKIEMPYTNVRILDKSDYFIHYVYSFEVPEEVLSNEELINHKTKYLYICYKIENQEYTELLKRFERKWLVTPT